MRWLLATALLAACARPPSSPPTTAPTTLARSPVAPRRGTPIALVGPLQVVAASFTARDLAALTHTELWRVSPERPDRVTRLPLSAPVRMATNPATFLHDAPPALYASEDSELVAVALNDGSVDVFDATARVRHVDAPAKADPVLEVAFAPGVLALTRRGSSWKRETVFMAIATGQVLGKIDGGRPVFDAKSKYIAARGGVTTTDGQLVWKHADGFLPVRATGLLDWQLYGDFAARGWRGNEALFTNDAEVILVDPPTRQTTLVPAKCTRKLASTFDAVHDRVIAACLDEVLVTELASRTTKRIKNVMPTDAWRGPIDIRFRSDVDEFVIDRAIFDPKAGTVRDAGVGDDMTNFRASSIGAVRRDGAFAFQVGHGLSVDDAQHHNVIDWSAGRISDAHRAEPAFASTACGAPPAKNPNGWRGGVVLGDLVVYASLPRYCICSTSGCVTNQLDGPDERPLAFRADGTLLSRDPQETLKLSRPGQAVVKAKGSKTCMFGTFVGDRIVLSCLEEEGGVFYELGRDLAPIARRPAPALASQYVTLATRNDTIIAHGINGGMASVVLPVDWVKDPSLTELAYHFAASTFDLTMHPDGHVDVTGDRDAAKEVMRCWDGASLQPWATCP